MLTQAQGAAYVAQLRTYLQSALDTATATQQKSESGVLHGVASILGLDSDSAVDAVPGDIRMMLSQVDALERSLPDATQDPSKEASWRSLAQTIQTNATADLNDQQHATLDGILSDSWQADKQDLNPFNPSSPLRYFYWGAAAVGALLCLHLFVELEDA